MAKKKRKTKKQKKDACRRNSVLLPSDHGCCELCGREQPLSFHHLIPCAVHTKKKFIKKFGKEEMKKRGFKACRLCHKHGIHEFIPDEKELAESYNTKEALLAHKGLAKHIAWVRKQK